jgi:hypothetical protein
MVEAPTATALEAKIAITITAINLPIVIEITAIFSTPATQYYDKLFLTPSVGHKSLPKKEGEKGYG